METCLSLTFPIVKQLLEKSIPLKTKGLKDFQAQCINPKKVNSIFKNRTFIDFSEICAKEAKYTSLTENRKH